MEIIKDTLPMDIKMLTAAEEKAGPAWEWDFWSRKQCNPPLPV